LTPIQRGKLRLIEKVTKQAIEVVDLPAAKDLNLKRIATFKTELASTISTEDISAYNKLITEYAAESGADLLTIAAALAHLARKGQPLYVREMKVDAGAKRDFGTRDRDFGSRNERGGNSRGERSGGKFDRERRPSDDRGERPSKNRRAGGRPASGMQRFQLAVGAEDGVRPSNIVGAIANESGISGRDIGPIDIRSNFTLIDLPSDMPNSAIQILRRTWVAGKQLKIRPFDPR
jgi:ATP-dependent RNA helicase DeaD